MSQFILPKISVAFNCAFVSNSSLYAMIQLRHGGPGGPGKLHAVRDFRNKHRLSCRHHSRRLRCKDEEPH
ncbi:hypothetical protein EMEDMD4_1010003 [Sinorhizobium medicae]|uniref:Uncharacterized protein n=1 Tax=Sinorhizobium medicae TaxID=110321 RepID=A0A508WP29_9HYPH|nr:hypothetical protein EMEDMD4_1010003 [Sinorhizobium medicae]